jgi:preprotein translocase subunit YajC
MQTLPRISLLALSPGATSTNALHRASISEQGDARPGAEPAEGPEAPGGGGLFGGGFGLLPMVAIFAILWFVMIAPERKNRRQREELLKNLKKGDEVMTSSGLYAKIAAIQDDFVVLQIADGVRAKYSRSAVQSVVQKAEAEAAAG